LHVLLQEETPLNDLLWVPQAEVTDEEVKQWLQLVNNRATYSRLLVGSEQDPIPFLK